MAIVSFEAEEIVDLLCVVPDVTSRDWKPCGVVLESLWCLVSVGVVSLVGTDGTETERKAREVG